MKTRNLIKTACLACVIGSASFLNAKPLVELKNIDLDKVHSAGFTLNKAGDFIIHGVGFLNSTSDEFRAMAWLIDGDTRQPVWTMDETNTERLGRKGLRETIHNIHLEKGRYELYYYASNFWIGDIKINGDKVFNFLGDIFEGKWPGSIESHLDKFYVDISPASGEFTDFTTYRPDGAIANALFQLKQAGDSEYLEQGFKLDKPLTLRIRALCEFPSSNDDPVDNCWIINSDTREKIWSVDRWNTDYYGGGRKNKITDQEVQFPKGNYVLYYITDDSHSFEKFNTIPPYDPYAWGVAVIPVSAGDKDAFHLFTPEGRGPALIQMTRIGDDADEVQAFRLDKDMALNIYCIGEYSSGSREFTDYGWIENAGTGKIVWEITFRNSQHAGGSKKNRSFEGSITLPKGNYIVHFVSDDSHSYDDWNDSAPYDVKSWGISIFPGEKFDKSAFHLENKSNIPQDPDVLVRMTALRDNVNKTDDFNLKERTKIHIYAIGEGDRDEMFDYGWIENESSGKTVWEMTWRNSEPAGGSSKNRLYNDSIILEPGRYTVHFVTDGSHSFNNWNAAKPRDPSGWGISVTIGENSQLPPG